MTDSWDKIKNLISRFRGLTEIGIANIVSSAISAFFWLYMAALLGTTHYGEVSYFIAVAGIAGSIASLGASNTVIVYTAKGEKIQPSIFFVVIIAGIVTSAILYLIYYNLGVSLYTLGSLIFGLSIADIMGRKLYRDYSKYVITQRILMVGFTLSSYYAIGLQGVVLGYGLSFFPYFFKLYKGFREYEVNFSLLKSRFGFMMNSYAFDLSRNFSGSTDKLIIAPLFGYSVLGNYQLGMQFLTVLNILPAIVFQYLLPHDANGNPNKILKKATIVISVGLTILGITLAPVVLPVLFPKFTEAIGIIQIISLSIIPYAINLTYISKFLGSGSSKIVLIGSLIYLTVQIITIIILGKIFGVNGIAASVVLATASESAYLISVNHFISKRELPKQ